MPSSDDNKGKGAAAPASEDTPLVPQKGDKPEWLESSKKQEENVETAPRRSKVLWCFGMFSTLAIIISASMILAQFVTIGVSKIEWVQEIMRFYVVMFCLLFILAEVQVGFFLTHFPSMDNWFFRGFLYSFVGMIGVEESYSVQLLEDKHIVSGAFAAAFLKAASFTMFFVGLLYMVMGICRLKNMRDRMQQNFEREQEAFQLRTAPTMEV